MSVHASAQVILADDVVDVQMSLADCIQFAQTIRTLTRAGRVPPGVNDIFNRVSGQILAAARIKIAHQKGGR